MSRAAHDRRAGAPAFGPGPVRTCAGCQGRAEQALLLRLALSGGRVVADPCRRRPGRGAYLHRSQACLERALHRGGLARAFRTQLLSPAVADSAEWLIGTDPDRVGQQTGDMDDERS